eukprot:CAMPEP_0174265118 /NCGR_PEP_ID=MMETSP0439-20130205/25341_1 /TAXON_ID=0 /ORGANISM="Stereomyxa ramosa, Strain Chinc5" /LENGTH=430 /DNA_ID=CAMNT_0015351411 /DNA_START=92 /DNA_END=1384 /DNA_ORIENTATION=+
MNKEWARAKRERKKAHGHTVRYNSVHAKITAEVYVQRPEGNRTNTVLMSELDENFGALRIDGRLQSLSKQQLWKLYEALCEDEDVERIGKEKCNAYRSSDVTFLVPVSNVEMFLPAQTRFVPKSSRPPNTQKKNLPKPFEIYRLPKASTKNLSKHRPQLLCTDLTEKRVTIPTPLLRGTVKARHAYRAVSARFLQNQVCVHGHPLGLPTHPKVTTTEVGWNPGRDNNSHDYLEIDLKRDCAITHISTKGERPPLQTWPDVVTLFRHGFVSNLFGHYNTYKGPYYYCLDDNTQLSWVNRYEVLVRKDGGREWLSLGTFKGNNDFNTEVVHSLHVYGDRKQGLVVRYLRIRPIAFHNHKRMRVGVYGVHPDAKDETKDAGDKMVEYHFHFSPEVREKKYDDGSCEYNYWGRWERKRRRQELKKGIHHNPEDF